MAAATLVFIVMAALAWRLKLRTAFTELLPSNDPGVVALTRMQKRIGDLSLLLIGIRSPDYQANLRYAEALTQKLRAQPPNVVNLATYHVRDVRDFFERNKWLYVSEDEPRSDPRPAAQRDQQAQEPAIRFAGRRRVDRRDAGADVRQERPRRPLPRRRVHHQGGRIRLDRGVAARRTVRRKRGRGAAQRRQSAHRAGPAVPTITRTCAPRWRGRSSPASPAATPIEARHQAGHRDLSGHRRDLHRPLLPPPARRYR